MHANNLGKMYVEIACYVLAVDVVASENNCALRVDFKEFSMSMKIKPILVTGSHRSSSTWAGRMLAAAPHTAYIHEPFNIGAEIRLTSNIFKHWFQYVCEENAEIYKPEIAKLLDYKYPFASNLIRLRRAGNARKLLREQRQFLLHKIKKDIPIIKDPIAVFSAEWLSQTFDMNVLVMIRHPAAFCSSLKIKNWKFDFSHFQNQPLLIEKYLSRYEAEINDFTKNEKAIIEQAILLWNCIHHAIAVYQENHPEWLFVRNEDISNDPVNGFRSIYSRLGLEFTNQSKQVIQESSGEHNATEQLDKRNNEFIRDSKKNISNWKTRLSQSEIDLVKVKTSEVSSRFYSEDKWQ